MGKDESRDAKYVIDIGPLPSLPVAGSELRFPVGRIYCVGRPPGRPWEMGKSFDESAPCTAIRAATEVGHPAKGAIWLKVNGQTKQQGDLAQQIWSVPEQINYLSSLVTLKAGDLIFSGTPAGVGPIKAGDKLEGHVDGVGDLVVSYRS